MRILVKDTGRIVRVCAVLLLGLLTAAWCGMPPTTQAQERKALDQPFVVEYYYKVRWGYAAEFIRLFKKNHYPVLANQIASGRILQVSAMRPRYHATEDGRWDYRITIVFKNLAAAHEGDPTETIAKQLFPDQETFKKEEQRRFEILLAHWDVPVVTEPLDR